MITRRAQSRVRHRLDEVPAVTLLGPRQVGKTTLALQLAKQRPSLYLDLESDVDRAKLSDPELYLRGHIHELVILDEVHRVPNIFQPLRALIDRGRQEGQRSGRFLLLGSASIDFLKQSGETLAGRVSYVELQPINALEVPSIEVPTLWVRGGFPDSLLANSDAQSWRWRIDFIRTYLERDIPQLGPRIPAETLRRFWTMLAHHQGQLLNTAQLARSLGVDGKTINRYLDLLVDLLLVRRLPAWHRNVGKRLVRSPKVFLRDSGILHAILGIQDREALIGHPIAGTSWEGFVIQTLLSAVPDGADAHFYRTADGAEIDLLLTLPGNETWAIEIKHGLVPKLERGFHLACADINPTRQFVIYGGAEQYPINPDAMAISLSGLGNLLLDMLSH